MYARVTTFPGLAPERIKATLEEFTQHSLCLSSSRSQGTVVCGRGSTTPVGARSP